MVTSASGDRKGSGRGTVGTRWPAAGCGSATCGWRSRPDGTAVLFPTCFEYLPGELLDHRVTDGDVGGYTAAKAEGDIRVIFLSSPSHLQDEVCAYLADGVLDAADLDDLAYMIMPPDIEFTDASIPRDVMERTVTELCLARVS